MPLRLLTLLLTLLHAYLVSIAWAVAPPSASPPKPVTRHAESKPTAPPIVIHTEPRPFDDLNTPLAVSAQRLWMEIAQPPRLKLPVAVKGAAHFFGLTVGGHDYLAVFGATRPPVLYIDVDGNSEFEDSVDLQLAPSRAVADSVLFEPAAFAQPDGKPPIKVRLQVAGNQLWTMPAEYREGRAVLDRQKCLFALVDRNLDGKYDNTCTLPPRAEAARDWDGLATDLNHNGRIDEAQNTPGRSGPWESQPITQSLVLDEHQYQVKVEADGSAIELTETEYATGKLTITGKLDAFVVLGESGFIQLDTSRDRRSWTLPAGRYMYWARTVVLRDGSNLWTLWGSVDNRLMEITPDEELKLGLASGLRPRGTEPAKSARSRKKPLKIQFDAVYEDDEHTSYVAALCNGMDSETWRTRSEQLSKAAAIAEQGAMYGLGGTGPVVTAGSSSTPVYRSGFG